MKNIMALYSHHGWKLLVSLGNNVALARTLTCACTCSSPRHQLNRPIPPHTYRYLQSSLPRQNKLGLDNLSLCTGVAYFSKTSQWFSPKVTDAWTLKEGILRDYLEHILEQYENTEKNRMLPAGSEQASLSNEEFQRRQPLAERMKLYLMKEADLKELHAMLKELSPGDEMMKMAQEDMEELTHQMFALESELVSLLVPAEAVDHRDIIVEVTAGVGGQEAMIFTKELLDMYSSYAAWKGWNLVIIEYEETELGGLRRASASISGREVYRYMKYESGVHRVQRVPKTEKSGRVHTSTATVAVLPQPSEIEVSINAKDLKVDTFKASGKGGQHVNKTESAVRITHMPTGLVAECQAGRSQIKNKETAMQILRSKLYQIELDKQVQEEQSNRRLQVGTAARSEKVRTYNFNQDRITDHRISTNLYDVDSFLAGGEPLDDLGGMLTEEAGRERLKAILEKFQNENQQSHNMKG